MVGLNDRLWRIIHLALLYLNVRLLDSDKSRIKDALADRQLGWSGRDLSSILPSFITCQLNRVAV
jgi:hypothetical protein